MELENMELENMELENMEQKAFKSNKCFHQLLRSLIAFTLIWVSKIQSCVMWKFILLFKRVQSGECSHDKASNPIYFMNELLRFFLSALAFYVLS